MKTGLYNVILIVIILGGIVACKKTGVSPTPVTPTPATDTIPNDPAVAASIGFFMDNWQPKSFSPATAVAVPSISSAASVIVNVNTAEVLTKIAPNYFGNNSNLWCGQLHTQAVLMNHLSNFKPGILRGPAGSISDLFFFNGTAAPTDVPDSLLNAAGNKQQAGYWLGKNTESWTFSIDGYYNMLQQTGSIGLLTVNYGYARYGLSANPVAAAAHLAAEWVRYDHGRTKYWEIGNETYGDWEAGYRINTATNRDGQPEIITGELYGRHFKIFADSMRAAAAETGVAIKIGAVLYDSEPQAWNTNTIKTWNSGYFASAGNDADFYSVHNYFTSYQENSTVTTILNSALAVPSAVKTYVNAGIRNAGLATKPIAMTEWNLFCSGSKQNVSAVAGVHSVIALGELIKNNYGAVLRWDIANRWDNGDDHGLFSYNDEPGVAQWNPRPAFFYMYYLQKMTGDRLLSSTVTGSSDLYALASSFSSGQKAVVLVNKGAAGQVVEVKYQYFTPGTAYYYYVLSPGTDNGNFSRMVTVNGEGPVNGIAGGPSGYTSIKPYSMSTVNGVKVIVPPMSVVYLVTDKRP